jgi:hypothetical protein
MEYGPFLKQLADYMPINTLARHANFRGFLDSVADKKLYSLSDYLVGTIPGDRLKVYQHENIQDVQWEVTDHANKIVGALGFYPVRMQMSVLSYMEGSGEILMMIGLIFDILMITFLELSVMLLHSLLSLSCQEKVFEFGVMRMVGLSKKKMSILIAI